MKLPRGVTGKELIKKLSILGYSITRQSGSHIRISTELNGIHHITIPNHSPIKVGTLSNILNELASHHKISKSEITQMILTGKNSSTHNP